MNESIISLETSQIQQQQQQQQQQQGGRGGGTFTGDHDVRIIQRFFRSTSENSETDRTKERKLTFELYRGSSGLLAGTQKQTEQKKGS